MVYKARAAYIASQVALPEGDGITEWHNDPSPSHSPRAEHRNLPINYFGSSEQNKERAACRRGTVGAQI